jgi:excisionase family DNA binding protein
MKESLMTTAETLKYLKINKITLYNLIKNKKLPAVRVGRQWRFRKDKLDDWLDKQ